MNIFIHFKCLRFLIGAKQSDAKLIYRNEFGLTMVAGKQNNSIEICIVLMIDFLIKTVI